MGIKIVGATISPQVVQTGQYYKISVDVQSTATETSKYRLSFRLGKKRGGIK